MVVKYFTWSLSAFHCITLHCITCTLETSPNYDRAFITALHWVFFTRSNICWSSFSLPDGSGLNRFQHTSDVAVFGHQEAWQPATFVCESHRFHLFQRFLQAHFWNDSRVSVVTYYVTCKYHNPTIHWHIVLPESNPYNHFEIYCCTSLSIY